MGTTDQGWKFLNGEIEDYELEDGSWGTRNSDGSAYYSGVDGSWGQRESDGRISYYGEDGSWGTRDSDGSGSYYRSDGESEFYNSDEDNSDNSSASLSDLAATIAGVGLVVLGSKLFSRKKEAETEKSYIYDEEIPEIDEEEDTIDTAKPKKRRNPFTKNMLAIPFVFILIGCVFLTGYSLFNRVKNRRVVGINAIDCIGETYVAVKKQFESKGFDNIATEALEDLPYEELEQENLVWIVNIDGTTDFSADDEFPFDERVTIKYHSAKEEFPPIEAKNAKGEDYKRIEEIFKAAGFKNIEFNIEYDITTGWITKDGEVKSVVISNDKYDMDSRYRIDSKITITYHTLKKNKPNEL